MSPERIRNECRLTAAARQFMDDYMKKNPLSGRGYSSILKVARTVADLEGEARIHSSHMELTVQFRMLDRNMSAEDDEFDQGSSRMT